MDLLFSNGIVDNHYLHEVFHSFLNMLPSERISITIEVTIVDNIKSII